MLAEHARGRDHGPASEIRLLQAVLARVARVSRQLVVAVVAAAPRPSIIRMRPFVFVNDLLTDCFGRMTVDGGGLPLVVLGLVAWFGGVCFCLFCCCSQNVFAPCLPFLLIYHEGPWLVLPVHGTHGPEPGLALPVLRAPGPHRSPHRSPLLKVLPGLAVLVPKAPGCQALMLPLLLSLLPLVLPLRTPRPYLSRPLLCLVMEYPPSSSIPMPYSQHLCKRLTLITVQ